MPRDIYAQLRPPRPWYKRLLGTEPRFRLIPLISHLWHERLTRSGRYVVTGAIATGIAGSLPEHMVGSFAFSFFASLIVLSLMISLLTKPRVVVHRTAPQRAMAGSSVPLTIRVTSEAKRTIHDLGAYEYRTPRRVKITPEAMYVAELAPEATVMFEYELTAAKRGSYLLRGPSAVSAFPFGLTHAKRFARQQQRVMVYPSFKPLQRIAMPMGQRYQPGGIALASKIGESMEFIGNRDYQPGDRVRDLHPRSWARVGKPIVRQYQQEYLTRVAMMVDTFIPPFNSRALEANLSLAAAVGDYMARQQFIVDLFAAGPQLYHFQAGRSLGYLDDILDILACLERSRSDPFTVIGPEFAKQVHQTSAVVALLLTWNDERRALLDQIAAQGVAVKSILVTNDEDMAARAAEAGVRHIRPVEIEQGVESL